MLYNAGKKIIGLWVFIELGELNGRDKLKFPVDSNVLL